jgi:hypothetical protein
LHLIVLPGITNPELPDHDTALMADAPRAYGFDVVDRSMRWPGHGPGGAPATDVMTFAGCCDRARAKLEEYERKELPYGLHARSFGVQVALFAVLAVRPRFLQRMMLWSPVPHWFIWEDLVPTQRDLPFQVTHSPWRVPGRAGPRFDQEESHRHTALGDAKQFYLGIVPVEWTLPQQTHRTIVCMGTEDECGGMAFYRYLIELCRDNPNVIFRHVEGARHVMGRKRDADPEVNRRWLAAVFGDEPAPAPGT